MADPMTATVNILTGTTASGKTAIALDWARKTGGWILSCDALLFYRGADIGTAKPTAAEREEIPHFGIDLCDPDEAYDLPRYIEHALQVLKKAEAQDVPVLVAGGSGFYTAAFHDPPPDPIAIAHEIRQRVQTIENDSGTQGLREALLQVDSDPDIDLLNPRRIAPALERCLATGLTTRELRVRHQSLPCPFAKWDRRWFRVERDPEELHDRIETRTRRMLEGGLIEEVKKLREQGFEKNPTLSAAIGYRETLAFLDGELGMDDLENAIVTSTTQLAKRQRRWIKNRLPETKVIRSVEELAE